MLQDVLDRINERLEAVGLSESAASKRAGLSADAIRNMRRQLEKGRSDAGTSSRTLTRLAPVLETSAEWLLTGRADPSAGNSVIPVVGYLGAGAEVEPDFEQVPPDGLEQCEVPFPLPHDMIAFKVRGTSMMPVFKPDAVIIVYREQKKPLEAFYGEEAAVRTSDGRRFIKTVNRGSQPGTVNLMSWNDPVPIEGAHLDWIGEIFAVLPPSAVKHIQRQSVKKSA